MKCIDACGYQEMPNNITRLQRHLASCLLNGAASTLKKEPKIVWKDGQFVVAVKTTKKDRVFDFDIQKNKAAELTPDKIKTAADIAQAAAGGPNVSAGKISDTTTNATRKRMTKEDLPDELT